MSLRNIKPYKNNSGRNLKIICRRKPKNRGDDSMDKIIERPCTILESISQSLREIKEFKSGKRTFRTLDESKKLWNKWIEEVENEESK